MTNIDDHSQYNGRRRELSNEEKQSAGRSSVNTAKSPLSKIEPPIVSPVPTVAPVVESSADVSSSVHIKSPLQVLTRAGLSKQMIIAICVAIGIIILLLTVIAINLSGSRNKSKDTLPEIKNETAARLPDAALHQQNDYEAPAAIIVDGGEVLYTGKVEYNEVEDMQISFVLSADKSHVRSVSFEIASLNATFDSEGVTTTVEVLDLWEEYSGKYPVDFANGDSTIMLDKSKLYITFFADNFVFAELDYVYYSEDSINGDITEIPLGNAYVELVADKLPEATVSDTDVKPTTRTTFDYEKLENWNDKLVGGIYEFKPAKPTPMYYIVCAEAVMDPKTKAESEGGYEEKFSRHYPVSTDDVLRRSGNMYDAGLTLTDDPDLATYALTITFEYDHTGAFFFRDNSEIKQYHGNTNAALHNMITGEIIRTENLKSFATYANENVYTQMLDNAKGKQLYAQSSTINASDFDNYWDFVEQDN